MIISDTKSGIYVRSGQSKWCMSTRETLIAASSRHSSFAQTDRFKVMPLGIPVFNELSLIDRFPDHQRTVDNLAATIGPIARFMPALLADSASHLRLAFESAFCNPLETVRSA